MAATALAIVSSPPPGHAAPAPSDAVRRVLTMLEAAAEDYREGVRDGVVVRPIELDEATAFVEEAQQRVESLNLDAATAERGSTPCSAAARAAIDEPGIRQSASPTRWRRCASAWKQATGVSALAYPAAAAVGRPRPAASSRTTASAVTASTATATGRAPRSSTPPPANFTDPDFMRGETPYDFFHVISLGKRNTAMPAWDGALSVQDRWDLVAYLWTLAPGPAGARRGTGGVSHAVRQLSRRQRRWTGALHRRAAHAGA